MRIVGGVFDRLVLLCCLAIGFAMLVPADGFASSARVQAAYDAVLANPDSLDSNVGLLRAQLAEADFQAASATLQRILLINPNFDRARLIRVAVFLRLGDNAAAIDDLNYLEGRPLSAEDQAEADRLAEIVRPSPTAPRLTGVARVGVLFDTNPSLSPGSGVTTNGQVFNAPEDSDFGAFGSMQFLGELPFGNGQGHSFRVEGDGFASAYAEGDADYVRGRLAAGPRIDLGFAFLDVRAIAATAFFNGEHYSHQLGGSLGFVFDVTDRLSTRARVEVVHEAVDVNGFSTTNFGDADGTLIIATPGLTYRFSDAWSASVNGLYSTKDAASAWYRYDAYGGSASLQFRNAAGLLFRAGGGVTWVDYDAANPNSAVSVPREDTRYSLNAGMAVPFALILEGFGQTNDTSWARGWSVEAFGRYTITQSNSALFESDNLGFGLSVARRFSL